jgi:tRNA (guanine37-N1)-methyltransferase
VPDVLLVGDHAAIARWRRQESLATTLARGRTCSRTRRSTRTTARSARRSGWARRDGDLYVALLHHPVYDKNGAVVTTAVTNMDVHDFGVSARTYDVRAFYVATPVPTLRRLVERIMRALGHGSGRRVQPHPQGSALALARLAHDLDAVLADIERETGVLPRLSRPRPRGRPSPRVRRAAAPASRGSPA